VVASGRDMSGGVDVVLRSGLLAGKHDGNSAAYDMKSLGKHIEAVRPYYSSTLRRHHLGVGSGRVGSGRVRVENRHGS
jgi:hypothetical protein